MPIVARVLGTEEGPGAATTVYLDRLLPVGQGALIDGYEVTGSVSSILKRHSTC